MDVQRFLFYTEHVYFVVLFMFAFLHTNTGVFCDILFTFLSVPVHKLTYHHHHHHHHHHHQRQRQRQRQRAAAAAADTVRVLEEEEEE